MIEWSGYESYFPCKIILALSCSTARSVTMVLSWGLSHDIFPSILFMLPFQDIFPSILLMLPFLKLFSFIECYICCAITCFDVCPIKDQKSIIHLFNQGNLLVIINIMGEFNISLKTWDVPLKQRYHHVIYWYLPWRSVFQNHGRKSVGKESEKT